MAGRDTDDVRAEPPRLTVSEAAALLGKSVEAVRAMIRRGKLETTRGNDGRVRVAVPSELRRVADQTRPDGDQTVELARLQAERDEALAEADHWRAQAHSAELALARAEGERDTARRVGEAELAGRDAVIAELRAELADARRPWWRRLLDR